ncbi:Gfo/Idh/MocA family protein [Algoriphagus sediminis]|uniref:Gfo/Idh/MocA family oxidoreductase n=1 Tax=Algoriphagus sediminis TaxID=3057113 RepID=A0ABT7YGD0_9BACT|nr:Gfo/Idh/MocA family oxidoreductase [Algoriphagus sediminis]MDN3205584.1 Gfo/Idh/MocA family oxidoreductase [Algoriphagus sediminis]
MKTLSKISWGIVGVGNVCEVKSAPAMQLIPNSRIEAVMRRNTEKAEDYAKRHGIAKWYSDADALINDPKVNSIYIATPPKYHLEMTSKAAKAGKPVYVEKPMARNFGECRKMIEVCKKHGVPLFVAYYRRALPHFVRIKELLDQGEIGSVRTVHINLKQSLESTLVADSETNWRVIPEIAGGGYFYDLASHQLDLLDFFFGPIQHASGYSANQAGEYEAEDIVVGNFVFENGVLGSGNWCFTTVEGAETDQIHIIGRKGEIRFETFGKGEFEIRREGKNWHKEIYALPKHIQQPLIETIVSELRGDGICPSKGESAARANWVMDQVAKPPVS